MFKIYVYYTHKKFTQLFYKVYYIKSYIHILIKKWNGGERSYDRIRKLAFMYHPNWNNDIGLSIFC